MANSANVQESHEVIHSLTKKPATEKDKYPCARCRICTIEGRKGVNTRWICEKCPEKPGLCSKSCFESYHAKIGFTMIAACKRMISYDSPPTVPLSQPDPASQTQSAQPMSEVGPLQPPPEEAPSRDLVPLSTWQQRQEAEHYLVLKPRTKRKDAPTMRCVECYRHGVRKERRTICHKCKKGFCTSACLRSYHLWSGIFETSSENDQLETIDENSNEASDEQLPGPSSAKQFDKQDKSYHDSSSPLHSSTYEFNQTPLNRSPTSWGDEGISPIERPGSSQVDEGISCRPRRGPHTPEGTPPPSPPLQDSNPSVNTGRAAVVPSSASDPIERRVTRSNLSANIGRAAVLPSSAPDPIERRVTRSQNAAVRTKDGSYAALDESYSPYPTSEEET